MLLLQQAYENPLNENYLVYNLNNVAGDFNRDRGACDLVCVSNTSGVGKNLCSEEQFCAILQRDSE
jgi:hypothetical protein